MYDRSAFTACSYLNGSILIAFAGSSLMKSGGKEIGKIAQKLQ
jgi:hypothetical protein